MAAELQLSNSQQQLVDRLIENSRRNPYKSEQTQAVHEKFLRLSVVLSSEEKDKVTQLFVEHVCGVNMENSRWFEEAGRILNGVGTRRTKYGAEKYWKEIKAIFPSLLSEQELEWIIDNDVDGGSAFHSFLTINSDFAPTLSARAQILKVYIHAYK